jgi:hypothetical protein
MSRPAALFAALAALLAAAAPAQAGVIVDRTVRCFEQRPVCVDPGARDVLSSSEARELARRIERKAPGPMYIAVVPAEAAAEAGGSVDGFINSVRGQLGQPGAYAAIVGTTFRAGGGPEVVDAATQAIEAHRSEGPPAILADFVDRVAQPQPAASTSDSGTEEDYGVSPLVPIVIVGGLFLLLFAVWGSGRRQRRKRESEQLQEVKRVARDDLVALGEDIRSLDLDVEMPSADPTAKEDFGRAVDLYKRAQDAFDTARRPQDLAPVTSAVEEGRYAVAAARARLEGKEPPERRPPCFFDPRHGPSDRDVEWAPPGGAVRRVPACAADAQRVESGVDPNVRQIDYAGRQMPYWDAPAYYGPWAGGFFGGFGAPFIGGLFLGEMLGGSFGWGGDYHGSDFSGDTGAGDLGGGDFGGGDFGGGDFGGGDFGGGDFGGGDF